ncbi:hypothetical protein V5799_000374 [Amblyomma americanum]|uniref:SDE2-like domain-containing protein n=1 Tax=Amblyomma americanum TaxID=6943 RepID=A0AAQ4D380_AMBAM
MDISTLYGEAGIEGAYGCFRRIPVEYLMLTSGGRRVTDAVVADGQWVTCVLTGIIGGKGGFGSMLRAIGAQIEKTTNREACRDLSGRRLRDINHEARLKRWVAKQAERENQRKQRKELREPQHKLEDPEYERIREQLPERVQDAVAQDEDPESSSGEGESPTAESSSERDIPNAKTASGDSESCHDSNSRSPKTEEGPEEANSPSRTEDPATSSKSTSSREEPQPTDKDK